MAKGGLAKQRFQERQQYNRIVGQLNQLRGAGYTTEQIRNAGNDAWEELGGGAQQVTVRDGDTIETIAQTTGASPVDLLAANPELKQVRTGMVINAPVVNQDMRGRGYGQAPGGIGLPSNSALGGATTNPGGWSGVSGSAGAANYNQTRPDYSILTTPRNSSGVPVSTANAQMRGRGYSQPAAPSFSGALYVPPGLSQTQRAAIPGILQGRGMSITTPQAATSTATAPPLTGMFTSAASQARAAKNDFLPLEFLSLAQSPNYTPSAWQTAYLERLGYLKKDNQTTVSGYGGGGYGRGGRGGGGGGGSGGGSRGGSTGARGGGGVTRAPAFSSGASFRGLVNWRI
jgi:hypothetical protein